MSKHIHEMRIGGTLEMRGPNGKFSYTRNMCQSLLMIAGGTGITPMIQLIRAIVNDSRDCTRIFLVYANVAEEDILLKSELKELEKTYPRFSVIYFLNNPSKNWKGSTGYVSKEVLRSLCPPNAISGAKALLCGPPPMTKCMLSYCIEIGFRPPSYPSRSDDHVFVF